MKTIDQWLAEYGESHQNETNKLIHWICVPAIFFTIVGLLYGIKLPVQLTNGLTLNIAIILILLTTLYYFSLSKAIAIGMFLFGVLCLVICYLIERFVPAPLWVVCLIIFVLAWFGQFYGHKVEGKKPSFFKDLQFLLIGPVWLMSAVFRKVGIKY